MRQLKPLLMESSAPSPGAHYVGDAESQSRKLYNLWEIRIGNFKVIVATLEDGRVAHDGKMPWIWSSTGEAGKQIRKWR